MINNFKLFYISNLYYYINITISFSDIFVLLYNFITIFDRTERKFLRYYMTTINSLCKNEIIKTVFIDLSISFKSCFIYREYLIKN